MKKYLDSEGVKFLWKDIIKPYINNYVNNLKDSQIIVSDNFEGAENDKGARYVVRQNKLIAILKDGHVEYAPEGVVYTESDEAFSFTINNKYNVEAGNQWTPLNLSSIFENQSRVFYGKTGLKKVGLYFDASTIKTFNEIFWGCTNLTEVDLTSIDSSNMTQIAGLFRECTSLVDIKGISEFNTKNVTTLNRTFNGVGATKLDLSSWDTSSVTDMIYTFANCTNLQELDISSWDTSSVTTMLGMFESDSGLVRLNVGGWDISAVTNFRNFLYGCKSLVVLDLSGWNGGVVENIKQMFSGCQQLTSLEINNLNVSNVTDAASCFSSLSSLKSLNLSNWVTTNLVTATAMFQNCGNLQALDLSNFVMHNVQYAGNMFYLCNSLHTLKLPNLGQLKADAAGNTTVKINSSPLGTAGEESRQALLDLFSYDRVANGLANILTVQLNGASKALLTPEEIAAITAKGYTIA